jgi:hypothetical protein
MSCRLYLKELDPDDLRGSFKRVVDEFRYYKCCYSRCGVAFYDREGV